MNKLNSARIAARNCDDESSTLVDNRIDSVYQKIIDLKTKAEQASAEANLERKKALNASKAAIISKRQAEYERNEAQRAVVAAKVANEEALRAAQRAVLAAQRADNLARITEASRLRTLALQVKDDEPTLALQLIKRACDTSYFQYSYATETLHSIVSTTHPASFYLKKFEKRSDDVSSVVLSKNGQFLVIGQYSDSLTIWDLTKTPDQGVDQPTAIAAGQKGAVLSLATSADGSVIASGDTRGSIHIRSSTLETQLILAGHEGAVLSVAIAEDKSHAVSSGEDKTVCVWDLTTGTLEKKLSLQNGNTLLQYGDVIQVCFSPDGNCIGTAGNDEVVRVWDWHSGNVLATLEGHLGAVRCVAFSPDGKYIISGGDDKMVKVWDWAKGLLIHSLSGHQGAVNSVAFASDTADYVLSASQDNTVRVWDLRNSRMCRELRGHNKSVFAAGFYDNSRYIYSGSYDRTVKLWDWKQDHMVKPNFLAVQSRKNATTITSDEPKRQRDEGSPVAFSISDTTRFSQYVITQGSEKTIWLWNAAPAAKPAYILYDVDNESGSFTEDIPIINSRLLYQALYQKLIKQNGKLIPGMTTEDRSRFLTTSQ
ncbi:WD40 repeat domain-containing protein [Spirosoma pollinicola]|uniref:WD40 repeat domain-containing protein n=1 Tax=Spirosoma pollinicola TaxID=2057025 RepID=UPI0014738457|nr:WD40 repeat domain-containing protein [Spirosoma pollinicola]